MCGIAGIYTKMGSQSASSNKKSLLKAASALNHRGPDGHGLFMRNAIGLAHTRLSIVDLEGGTQPLHSPDDKLHVVANGEIYNYPDIHKPFLAQGGNSSTASDCEAILDVYQQYGSSGFAQLEGMFAFALFDDKSGKLFLARDRLGIKPLYYADTPSGLVFASEIKGLLPLLEGQINKQADINAEGLSSFLNYQFNSGRETIFRSIKRVLPGEYLEIDQQQRIMHHQYWSATQVEPREISLEEAMEEFASLFDEVMQAHLQADVPLGLFLSGGIDSSVMLAKLTEIYDQPLRTYSLGYKDAEDELQQANDLAHQFKTEHTPLTVTRDDLFGRIVHTIWATDDLMRDYACLPIAALSDAAAKDLKVVFSGEGGDEAFAGYRRYAPSLESTLKSWVFGSGGVKTRGQWSSRGIPKRALSDALRQTQPRKIFTQAWDDCPNNWSAMQKKQYVDLTTSLPDNLFVKSDRITMAFGLEGRVPFSDHRLVEFGLSLPNSVKYSNNRGKLLIRQWAETILPHEHLQRPKRGFHVPVKTWLSGKFLDQLTDKLLHNKAVQEWFDIAQCKVMFDAQKSGKNMCREIWGLMQFAIWHGLFVEGSDGINGARPNPIENPLDWI